MSTQICTIPHQGLIEISIDDDNLYISQPSDDSDAHGDVIQVTHGNIERLIAALTQAKSKLVE